MTRNDSPVGPHIVDGQFKSDKYDWCPAGFVPMKLTDPMAQVLLWQYAELRRAVDEDFALDLQAALSAMGFDPANPPYTVTGEPNPDYVERPKR